jgi:hypothetical protein
VGWIFTLLAIVAYIGGFPADWGLYMMLLALPVGWIVCTFLHELGHAVGAKLVRWQVVVFAVGRIAYQVPNRGFGLLKRDDENRELAGWVLSVPVERRFATLRRDLVVTSAGPLANLLFAIILMAVALNIAIRGGQPRFEPSLLVAALACQSMTLFVTSAIPHFGAGRANDGASMVEQIRQRASKAVALSPLTWMLALRNSGTRLRDYPEWLVSDCYLATRGNAELERWLETVRIGRALDAASPDAKAARGLIDAFHDRHPPNHWSVACEAYLAAVFEHRIGAAEAAMEKVTGPSDTPQLTLAAQAAIGMKRGRTAEAKRDLDAMDVIVRRESVFADLTYRDIRRIIEGLPPSGVRPLIADVNALS